MSQHVPDDLLASFVDGEVGEQLAVHIAEHLDDCPACATRAAGLEPLGAAFAAIDDPVPPPELAREVLERVAEPERLPVLEIGVGAALLVSAAALATLLESPLGMAVELGVVLHGLATLTRALAAGLGASSLLLTVATFLALAGCAITARLARPTPIGVERRLP